MDGHALIQVLEKPHHCSTFGDYGEVFLKVVLNNAIEGVRKIDVVAIENCEVPLPEVWSSFISSGENNAGLAHFQAQPVPYVLMEHSEDIHLLIVS